MSELLSERVITATNDIVLSRGGLKSNYERLFGTPERTAWTLFKSTSECRCCVVREECDYDHDKCMMYDHDKLLEWLRGEGDD